ncbi:MAG: putative selenium-dependent hydroxylase accessory protein YqeC [Anaerolineales bacterium]|nr:putative selenium-dependent hydroxylase accessory protein YqeC [Anaerolineales bacterium]
MELLRALRLDQTKENPVVCFVGSGGKTTALFQLARQILAQRNNPTVFIAATTHLGEWQIPLADSHFVADNLDEIQLPPDGVILFTGRIENQRAQPTPEKVLRQLRERAKRESIPLLVEADGSRQTPLKAPADHEPPIPAFADWVIHVSGLSALGKPLNEEHVYRAENFSALGELTLGEPVKSQALTRVIAHPQGGLKNIPQNAKRIALLNQAESAELQSVGGGMARSLLDVYDAALVGSLRENRFRLFEKTAGVILAAGKASRYGDLKQLLDWKGKPFVRRVAETALQANLNPVVVVVGFRHAEVESHLRDLPVTVVYNPDFEQGQSSSVKAGINVLPSNIGAAIFLLADQPQIPASVVQALTESHNAERQSILAPLVLEERRANPVLMDRVAFPDLLQLSGDAGGRAIFDKHKVSYLAWHDDSLLFDVDKPEDYEKLKGAQT